MLRKVQSGLRCCRFPWIMVTLLLSCSSSTPPTDFLDESLTGQITGKDWDYLYGFVDPTIDTPEEDDMVIVLLPYKPKERCPPAGVVGSDRRTVMVSVPLVKKLTRLKSGSNRNAVFQHFSGGKRNASVVKAGKVKLDVINSKKIQGRLFAKINNTNWVSGKFSAEVCEFADFK